MAGRSLSRCWSSDLTLARFLPPWCALHARHANPISAARASASARSTLLAAWFSFTIVASEISTREAASAQIPASSSRLLLRRGSLRAVTRTLRPRMHDVILEAIR